MDFIDTNILIYANDSRDKKKQKTCVEIVSVALRSRQGTISTQVLSEYANVALTKLKQPPKVIRRQIELLSTLPLIAQTPQLIIRAVEIKELYGLSFWDASIVAAAESGRCDRILSEDMNDGQIYCGMKMTNPLAEKGGI